LILFVGPNSHGSFENLALFAAAVVAANAAGVPAHQLNQLTGGYLISRVLFNL